MDPKDIVRSGYDRVSRAYRGDEVNAEEAAKYAAWIDALIERIGPPGDVLELGCGNGVPAARLLIEAGYRVTGVDISPVQIERARQLVPAAEFECADMTQLQFAEKRFSAIVSLYAIIHVPVAEQPGLLRKIRAWLKPGGILLIIVGATAWTGTEENWLDVAGASMYWSHADAATYTAWLTAAGFRVELSQFVPEGDGGHTLILARASGATP